MGCGGFKCGQQPCQCRQEFTELSQADLSRTLARALVPCVDAVRDLYTCLGVRPYEVAMIRTRWSSGRRGVGVEEVVEERKILPTPLVPSLNALDTVVEAIGEQEMGEITVSQISARYTEDELLGRRPGGEESEPGEDFFWEVRLLTDDGMGWRRRFLPHSAPHLDFLKFQWTINLLRAVADRARSGETRH